MSLAPAPDGLETERLVLRPRRPDEATVYRELWTERDPRVPAHRRIDAHGRPSVADIASFISTEQPGILAVERKDTAEVIGYVGLVADDQEPHSPELAFELLSAAHGRGYATEAGAAVVAWARDAGYDRLWATVWDWNAASLRVLEKLGFHDTGQVERTSEHGRSLVTMLTL